MNYRALHDELLRLCYLSSKGQIRGRSSGGSKVIVRGPWQKDGYPKEVKVAINQPYMGLAKVIECWWSELSEERRDVVARVDDWEIIKPKSPLISLAEQAE